LETLRQGDPILSEQSEAKVLRVVEELCQQLNPQQTKVVNASSHLEWDLGIGSLERAELIRRLEKELGHSLPSQPLFAAPRVRDLVAAVQAPRQQSAGLDQERLSLGAPLPPFPVQAQTLIEALDYQRQHQPDRLLFYFEDEGHLSRSLSPSEMWREAAQMAGALAALGVKKDDTVALMLPTGLSFVAGFLAILWLGAVPVPLYPPFRADQAEDYLKRQVAILENALCKVLISFDRAWSITQMLQLQAKTLEKVVSAESLACGQPIEPTPVGTDQLALIQYTSGSTGSPKGVALSHANLLHNLRAYGKALQVGPEDVCISWLPLYHDMGLIGSMLGSMYHGIPLVLMGPQDFLARPSRWIRAMSHYGGSISPAPNFAYEICARRIPDEELQNIDLSRWRVALNGAEAILPDTLERFSKRYGPLGYREGTHFPCYGLAEASLAVAFSPLQRGPKFDRVDEEKLQREGVATPSPQGHPWVACGYPLEGTELSIRDEHGRELGERRQGRLFFRSGSSLREYYRNPEATREIKSEDGWVDTGDLAYLAEGELYITGRAKDLIIKAGRNLYPQDIEAAATEVDGVRRGCVAAFSVPGSQGERLVVVYETRNPSAALRDQVMRAVTQACGVGPDEVKALVPGSIPKTPSGKIRRSECRKLFQEGKLGYKAPRWLQGLRLLRQVPLGRSLRGLWSALALFGVMGPPALVIARLHGGLGRRSLGKAARLALRMLGVRLNVKGKQHDRPCVLVINHASLLDPVVVLASSSKPLLFLVAPWIYNHPVLAKALRNMKHLKISRGEAGGAPRLAREMVERVQAGHTLAAFPEGGLETTPGLREFNLGVFQVAAENGLTIQPVVLIGTRKAMPWPTLVPQPMTLEVEFGPPMQARGQELADAVDLARHTRQWIAERCGEDLLNQRLRRE
jgi:1-acyl-sn-glycerol-3-phosphate acyltransferase